MRPVARTPGTKQIDKLESTIERMDEEREDVINANREY